MNLELIHFVQQLKHPLFVSLIKFLNFFDRQEFLFVLLPFIWIGLGRRMGIRIFYILILSSSTCNLLKSFFAHPRPFHIDPSLGIIQVSGFSFPSGAAQTAALLAALMLFLWKNKWKWVVAPVYFLMICFSRVYLGVHFLEDILFGTAVGMILFLTYVYLFPKIENLFSVFSSSELTYLTTTAFFFIVLASTKAPFIQFFSAAIGVSIGCYLCEQITPINFQRTRTLKIALDIPITILGAFFIYAFFEKTFFSMGKIKLILQSLSLGLWISFNASFLVTQLIRSFQKTEKVDL